MVRIYIIAIRVVYKYICLLCLMYVQLIVPCRCSTNLARHISCHWDQCESFEDRSQWWGSPNNDTIGSQHMYTHKAWYYITTILAVVWHRLDKVSWHSNNKDYNFCLCQTKIPWCVMIFYQDSLKSIPWAL